MNLTGMLLALAGKIMVESVWEIGIVHSAGETTGNQPGPAPPMGTGYSESAWLRIKMMSPYQATADSRVLSVSVMIATPDICVGSSPNACL